MSWERGETISGAWDPEIGARRVVELPALTAEQTRQPEYFWPTRQQRRLFMPKQEQQGGDGEAAGEVEGPFDPDRVGFSPTKGDAELGVDSTPIRPSPPRILDCCRRVGRKMVVVVVVVMGQSWMERAV